MHWIFSLYVVFLFFVLTPAILVRLPPKAGKFTVAGVHAVVFALVLHFTGKMVWNFSRSLEGFQEGLSIPENMFFSGCKSNMMGGSPFSDKEGRNPVGPATYKSGDPLYCVGDNTKLASNCNTKNGGSNAVWDKDAKLCYKKP
jgi:hypothetical protein